MSTEAAVVPDGAPENEHTWTGPGGWPATLQWLDARFGGRMPIPLGSRPPVTIEGDGWIHVCDRSRRPANCRVGPAGSVIVFDPATQTFSLRVPE